MVKESNGIEIMLVDPLLRLIHGLPDQDGVAGYI